MRSETHAGSQEPPDPSKAVCHLNLGAGEWFIRVRHEITNIGLNRPPIELRFSTNKIPVATVATISGGLAFEMTIEISAATDVSVHATETTGDQIVADITATPKRCACGAR